jgi:lysophospholipase L1-like esterase
LSEFEEREPATWAGRAGAVYRDVALIGLGTLLALLLFELLAAAVMWVLDRDVHRGVAMPYYRESDWGQTHWREYRDLEKSGWRRYEPFVLWRLRSFSGETINVDENGIRRTPGARCSEENPTLFVLGGSTTWGVGAPDWGTIPAYLLEELGARMGGPGCVMNLAQGGHVSTQELIELVRKLESGARPDFVIFYDGINDAVAAAESGRVDAHQGLADIRHRFERTDSALGRVLQQSHLGQLADRARKATFGQPPYPDHFDVDALAAGLAAQYLAHAEAVQALARAYGFDAALFWQPVITVGTKPLSPREQALRATLDPSLVKLFDRTWPAVERAFRGRDRLFYIADVLDDFGEEVYADRFHVTPIANQAIARRIAELAWGPRGSRPARP